MNRTDLRQRMNEMPDSDELEAVETDMAVGLGEQVKALREQAGLSRLQLAALMSTSQTGIIRLENGDATPRISTLLRVLAALQANLHLDLDTEGIEVKLAAKSSRRRMRAAG